MEEFKKIQKPQQRHINIDMPTAKAVTVPKYDTLAKEALVKDKYLSEFKSEADKQKARDNLGIGNSFKVVGEFDTLEELQSKVLVGKESEAYLIGNDIYTWSEALKKWFKYGAAGSSANDLAQAFGYKDWTDQMSKTYTKIIYGLELIEAEELYSIIDRLQNNNFQYYKFFGEYHGEYFPLDISQIAGGYAISFTTPEAWHTIKVSKSGNDYFGNWRCMQISN